MKRMFLHGLDSSSQGNKARLLSALGVTTPDFRGSLSRRMERLHELLDNSNDSWLLIGSSMGGLMAALYAMENARQITRLILMAPALNRPEFVFKKPIDTPTLLIHGTRDEVIPHEAVKARAEAAFNKLTVHWVEDDHRLAATSAQLDWPHLLGLPRA